MASYKTALVMPAPSVIRMIIAAYVVILLHGLAPPLYAGNDQSLPVIRVALFERVRSPDPAQSTMYEPHTIAANVFETLVTSTDSGNILPGIASSWSSSPDGKRWTFTIPGGRSFHDDSPLDAHAVEFSFQRLINPAHQLYHPQPDWKTLLFSHVNSIRAIDSQTLQIDLDTPYAPLLHNLSTTAASIISPRSLQSHYDGQTTILAGSGPFRIASFQPESITLAPAKPSPDGPQTRINFVYYPQKQLLNAYLQNRVDVIAGLAPADKAELLAASPPTLMQHTQLSILFLLCNGANPDMRNVALRRAISLGINRSLVAEKAIGKNAVAAKGFLPPGIWATEPSLPTLEYSPEQARKLLTKAGYPQGIELNAIQIAAPRPFLPDPQALASELQKSLLQAGIILKIDFVDAEQFFARIQKQDFDIAICGWVPDTRDPDNVLSTHLYAGKENPHQRIVIERLDELILLGRSEQDLKKRMQHYSTAQYLIHKKLPCIPILHSRLPVIIRPTIQGIQTSSAAFLLFNNATVQHSSSETLQTDAP